MTVSDLITRSMRLLGALNIGDQPTAAEAQNALTALNALADAWALERLLLYTTGRNLYNLAPNQQVYQIGPLGPDWIAPRPLSLEGAGLIISSSDPTQVLEVPLEVLRTDRDWQMLRVKGITSTLPTKLYYDHGFSTGAGNLGSGNIALWPVPTQANQIALYTPTAISQFTGLTQTISLPPGYNRALVYSLAIEMAPEFDRQPSEVIVAVAERALDNLKRTNLQLNRLRCDPALTGAGRGWSRGWNWQIGE
jgi:hypothetical protein